MLYFRHMNKLYIKLILGVIVIAGLVIILKLQGQEEGSPEPVKNSIGNEKVNQELLMQATDKPLVNIKRIIKQNNTYSLEYDEVEWLEGDTAAKAALADKQCTELIDCTPNGFYIRNKEIKIQSLPISKSAKVVLTTLSPSASADSPTTVTLTEFISMFQESGSNITIYPFHLRIETGLVTKIEEQYTP